MRIVYERCCGLDIHKVSIAVCVVITRDGKTEEETRRSGYPLDSPDHQILCRSSPRGATCAARQSGR